MLLPLYYVSVTIVAIMYMHVHFDNDYALHALREIMKPRLRNQRRPNYSNGMVLKIGFCHGE